MQWPMVVQGREVNEEKMRWLSGWIGAHAHWSRRKLAGEWCVLWDWRDGSGRPKDLAARSFLLKLEARGWIALPPLREACRKPWAGIRLPAWLETFVERGRFAGTCYKAANWVRVGATRGRGRQDRQHRVAVPEKDVYLFPIHS